MRRRDFIKGIAGSAAAWPVAARAADPRPRVGVLNISSRDADEPNIAAFRDNLQRLGYIEGKTVDVDQRYADGDASALPALAQSLVELKPNVALATAVSPTRALKRIAPSLPIVCPAFSDAFVPSLAASFARPAGSVTGIASDVEGMFGKLTELTLDAVPGTTKIGFLANPLGGSIPRYEQQVLSTAGARSVEVLICEVKEFSDLGGAFERFSKAKVQAIIVPGNGLLNAGRQQIVALASAARLPLIFSQRIGVAAGGLASYGVDTAESYRRAAAYVDKILKGAVPGDLPIEFPTALLLVINLKTAKALGISVPAALLSRADEVIE